MLLGCRGKLPQTMSDHSAQIDARLSGTIVSQSKLYCTLLGCRHWTFRRPRHNVMDQFKGPTVLYFHIQYICTHMDTHARPYTKHRLDNILSHQTPSHCHCKPMSFISASFQATTLIPTPTLQSQMLSMEEETTLAWRVHAYEIPQKIVIYILRSHLTGTKETF